ncbi:MAG TPA: methylated-DNA--[protein]-cysteine S-methyltransferase [Bacteroidales bacterium]|nr:methylated-DNA--[protein]-cysteine S-methyltransferase [Bacteroidales bacterium]
MIFSKQIPTPIGAMLAFAVEEGICLLDYCDNPELDREKRKLKEGFDAELAEQSNAAIELLETQLGEYFAGRRKSFSVPLCPMGSDFQKKVWEQLSRIDYGKTVTYMEQAVALGKQKAIRAVAGANGANKIAIVIPCHRVVGSTGNLTGYRGGLWRKKFLLDLESAQRQIEFF